jgi:hypothetical protein
MKILNFSLLLLLCLSANSEGAEALAEMVEIKGGKFTMGDKAEPDAIHDGR